MNYTELFGILRDYDGIGELWIKELDFLAGYGVPDGALKLLCIYFSLLDDGNVCISLDKDVLGRKWLAKVESLQVQKEDKSIGKVDFAAIIDEGIRCLSCDGDSMLKHLFRIDAADGGKWLFATRYFNAKNIVAGRMPLLFKKLPEHDSGEYASVKSYFANATSTTGKKPFELKDRQVECIVRGSAGNLIVNGGPGTGKTTVVAFLLWKLLCENPSYMEWDIKFAAPSGKAAERIRESIDESLSLFSEREVASHSEVMAKLRKAGTFTIHKLLGVNFRCGGFNYNARHRFPDNTLLVIDEASMIDLPLFASLLSAIPDNARVFLLGDDKQLPSVQAGAVLGELLASKKFAGVELVESNRFNIKSEAGRLASSIQSSGDIELPRVLKWDSGSFDAVYEDCYPVVCFDSSPKDGCTEAMLVEWAEKFWSPLYEMSTCADMDDTEHLKAVIKCADKARILCAEKQGARGCIAANSVISAHFRKSCGRMADPYYPGLMLIVTDNLPQLDLSNGDTGVVIMQAGRKYVLFGNLRTIPLADIPFSSIDTSYAITIHKSQGSGYENILVFLPLRKGHPLLNRQILYTAVTRTKGKTFIAAGRDVLQAAKDCVICRDTGLDF